MGRVGDVAMAGHGDVVIARRQPGEDAVGGERQAPAVGGAGGVAGVVVGRDQRELAVAGVDPEQADRRVERRAKTAGKDLSGEGELARGRSAGMWYRSTSDGSNGTGSVGSSPITPAAWTSRGVGDGAQVVRGRGRVVGPCPGRGVALDAGHLERDGVVLARGMSGVGAQRYAVAVGDDVGVDAAVARQDDSS